MKKKISVLNKNAVNSFKMIIARLSKSNYQKFESQAYMPLSIEFLYNTDLGKVYSFAQTSVQNGDLMYDPEITYLINEDQSKIIPLTFTNHYQGIYQEVFDLSEKKFSPQGVKDLVEFSNQWIPTLVKQYDIKKGA